jgi:hypothetical protein
MAAVDPEIAPNELRGASLATPPTIDQWSPLSYKTPLATGQIHRSGHFAPSWVDEWNRRRLTAYTILASYDENVARTWLDDDDDADGHREYGDPALVIDATLDALLGEEQVIRIAGAELYDPELPSDAPDVPAGAEPPADQPSPDEVTENAQARALAEREDLLVEWAENERFPAALVECERNAVTFGSGVYLLQWSNKRQRPTVTVYDPGFYFPVLPDNPSADEYPSKVHFAWEIPEDPLTSAKAKVRRITYELAPIVPRFDLETEELVYADPGDRETDEGVVRRYPWAASENSLVTCYLTDATWLLEDIEDDLDVFDLDKATFEVNEDGDVLNRHDLLLDFLPIVHIPNTIAGSKHFGQSSIAKPLQLLDDLAAADTDAERASATNGNPPVWLSGTRAPVDVATGKPAPIKMAAGEAWFVGDNGRGGIFDTSKNLAEARNRVDGLRDRTSIVTRLPGVVLGTVKPSEAPSGFAMALGFTPTDSMVDRMRLARKWQYRLFWKFVQRLFMHGKKLAAGETFVAELEFGAFLPTDVDAIIEQVRKLLGDGASQQALISLETAVAMLIDAGLPIDDAVEEVRRIEGRSYSQAGALADALGDVGPAYDLLQIDPPAGPPGPPVPPVPPIPLPPTPPGPAGA